MLYSDGSFYAVGGNFLRGGELKFPIQGMWDSTTAAPQYNNVRPLKLALAVVIQLMCRVAQLAETFDGW